MLWSHTPGLLFLLSRGQPCRDDKQTHSGFMNQGENGSVIQLWPAVTPHPCELCWMTSEETQGSKQKTDRDYYRITGNTVKGESRHWPKGLLERKILSGDWLTRPLWWETCLNCHILYFLVPGTVFLKCVFQSVNMINRPFWINSFSFSGWQNFNKVT